MGKFLKHYPLTAYFVLAYAISWLIWLPLVLAWQEWSKGGVSSYLHALEFMGPMVAAIVVTAVTSAMPGINQLINRTVRQDKTS